MRCVPCQPPQRLLLARAPASAARNFAIAAISFTGTSSDSGNRIVPLLIWYGASSFLNFAASSGPQGYSE